MLWAGQLTVASLWVAIPCRGFVLIGARGTASGSGHRPHPSASVRRAPPRMATTDELDDDHPETYGVLPLFAPTAETETTFSLPAAELLGERPYLYTFDTPASIRMLRSVEGGGGTLFGHCITSSADGQTPGAATVGSVGVAARLLEAGSEAFGGRVVTVDVVSTYRFVVVDLVSSFPFVTARRVRE
jgi:hypothetical protein